jgi:hypothetical protein
MGVEGWIRPLAAALAKPGVDPHQLYCAAELLLWSGKAAGLRALHAVYRILFWRRPS